jgi:hypothetical protein
VVDVVELLLHDGAAVAKFGERLGEAASEPTAHSGGEYDDLRCHD